MYIRQWLCTSKCKRRATKEEASLPVQALPELSLSLSLSLSPQSPQETPVLLTRQVPSTRGVKTGWKKRWILGGRGRSGRAAIWQEAALPCCRYHAVGCFSAVGFNNTDTRTAPAGGATRVAAEFWLAGWRRARCLWHPPPTWTVYARSEE